MKFTDADLERLRVSIVPGSFPKINGVQATALLHRLECAEELLEAGQAICDPVTYSRLEEAWRSSRGEE